MCCKDTVRIPLRARDGSVVGHTLIDAADADFVNQWTWRLSPLGYARRGSWNGGHMLVIPLHRALLGLQPDRSIEVDHINRDKLDNRRANLRVLARGCNSQNQPSHPGSSSKYRGVCWYKTTRQWQANVGVNGKVLYLGRFDTEEEAAEVARAARLKYLPFSTD